MDPERLTEKSAELEALLFINGEPLDFKKLAQLLRINSEELETIVKSLETSLTEAKRGLGLLVLDGSVQLVTKPRFASVLENFVKDQLSEDLTPASLETLAVVTYLGPIMRSRVEYIRGVNSIFTLRNLLLRGLVERYPNPDRPNSYLYKPSFELMRHLGVNKKENLPEFEKFKNLLKAFENRPEPEPTANE